MSEPYFTRLAQIVDKLGLPQAGPAALVSRHFFSGAALYANGKFFASLSPAGFAIKLPSDARKRLIEEGVGAEFRFFASGPIKREYVVLSDSIMADDESLRELIVLGINYASDQQDTKMRPAK